MGHPADIFGLLPGDEVERAVLDLERQGVFPDEIEVRTPPAGRYRLHDEMLHSEAREAARSGVAGAVLGTAVGALALLALDGFTTAGAVLWTLMGAGGFGLLIGGMAGLLRRDPGDDDPAHLVEPPDGVRLVAVHCLHWRNRAHRILERHGATFLDTPEPV